MKKSIKLSSLIMVSLISCMPYPSATVMAGTSFSHHTPEPSETLPPRVNAQLECIKREYLEFTAESAGTTSKSRRHVYRRSLSAPIIPKQYTTSTSDPDDPLQQEVVLDPSYATHEKLKKLTGRIPATSPDKSVSTPFHSLKTKVHQLLDTEFLNVNQKLVIFNELYTIFEGTDILHGIDKKYTKKITRGNVRAVNAYLGRIKSGLLEIEFVFTDGTTYTYYF